MLIRFRLDFVSISFRLDSLSIRLDLDSLSNLAALVDHLEAIWGELIEFQPNFKPMEQI